MMKSLTGAFGISSGVLRDLLAMEDQLTRRASHVPPAPTAELPEQDAHSSGVRAAVRLPEEDEDPAPVTVDLTRPRDSATP